MAARAHRAWPLSLDARSKDPEQTPRVSVEPGETHAWPALPFSVPVHPVHDPIMGYLATSHTIVHSKSNNRKHCPGYCLPSRARARLHSAVAAEHPFCACPVSLLVGFHMLPWSRRVGMLEGERGSCRWLSVGALEEESTVSCYCRRLSKNTDGWLSLEMIG